MGCNAEKLQIQTAEKRGLFSSLFSWAGRLFANCSNLPQRIATIVWHNKGALRENGTDIPHNLRKVLPAKAHAGTIPCGCGRSSGAQQAHKKTVSRFYARQQPERRTDYQIPPDQAAMFRGSYTAGSVAFLLLSTTLPAFCLRIFPEMPESARSEELPLPPPPAYKTAPASFCGNRGGSFALWVPFSGAHAKPCEGSLGKPRVCGEKDYITGLIVAGVGSPPRMRGKVSYPCPDGSPGGITPAYAGKSATSM